MITERFFCFFLIQEFWKSWSKFFQKFTQITERLIRINVEWKLNQSVGHKEIENKNWKNWSNILKNFVTDLCSLKFSILLKYHVVHFVSRLPVPFSLILSLHLSKIFLKLSQFVLVSLCSFIPNAINSLFSFSLPLFLFPLPLTLLLSICISF